MAAAVSAMAAATEVEAESKQGVEQEGKRSKQVADQEIEQEIKQEIEQELKQEVEQEGSKEMSQGESKERSEEESKERSEEDKVAEIESMRARRAAERRKQLQEKRIKLANETRMRRLAARPESSWSSDDATFVEANPELMALMRQRHSRRRQREDREAEATDDPETLRHKATKVATLLQQARTAVVYTGAGLSTASGIPCYRGQHGIYTKTAKNSTADTTVAPTPAPTTLDLTACSPTRAHQALTALVQGGVVQHVVSQNVDGLHRRSGLSPQHLSEIHGNAFLEYCPVCSNNGVQASGLYARRFDVTGLTARHRHATGRNCPACATPLLDTIVHYGEAAHCSPVHNWEGIEALLPQVDLILVLGSSLKVLKHYKPLWQPLQKKASLIVVNLQWTPLDARAALVVRATCDAFLEALLNALPTARRPAVPDYDMGHDALWAMAVPLTPAEDQAAKEPASQISLREGWFAKGVTGGQRRAKRVKEELEALT
ncbi:uncharacterized protein MONBRDRAFT_28831 [Monosiga brevicollis MX1]|uniref:Regulatory protein SIR2 homolog 7 n=1 Tax=Monosiga brevicollis TaxID=81824 RepID=A9V9J9_MONBE|nr:uncharacterized protein MONBRDRAFT_28831 [Monosiga brevicollis MX1]EDQ85877.1 predicted protein [Monosiga brevicollis MX1]|eukprot:XP_001749356.1 hypothetical protein [Monosiga brevicollis MX1]